MTTYRDCPTCGDVTPHVEAEPKRTGIGPALVQWKCTRCGRNNGA